MSELTSSAGNVRPEASMPLIVYVWIAKPTMTMASHKVDYAVFSQKKHGENLNYSLLAAQRNGGLKPYATDEGNVV